MKLRVFVRILVAAIVLLALFGAIHHPVQAKASSYTSFRTLEKRTTLVDMLTMTSADPMTILAYNGTGLSDICPPLQGDRSNPSIGPDWLSWTLHILTLPICRWRQDGKNRSEIFHLS